MLPVAFYALYVMYVGMPVLMKNPKEKPFTTRRWWPYLALWQGLVLGTVTSALRPAHPGFNTGGAGGTGGGGEISTNTPAGKATINTTRATSGAAVGSDTASMTIKTPDGEVKIDVKQTEAFAKQMQDIAAQTE